MVVNQFHCNLALYVQAHSRDTNIKRRTFHSHLHFWPLCIGGWIHQVCPFPSNRWGTINNIKEKWREWLVQPQHPRAHWRGTVWASVVRYVIKWLSGRTVLCDGQLWSLWHSPWPSHQRLGCGLSLPYLWKVGFPSQKVAGKQLHRGHLEPLRKTDCKHSTPPHPFFFFF